MFVTVKEVLSHLSMRRLRALLEARGLDVPRRRDQAETRLARSYRGDLASILDALHRPELLEVAHQQSNEGQLDRSPRWRQLRANDLRELLLRGDTQPASVAVGLYSTGRIGNARSLDINALRDDARNARRATVVSAYYIPKMLKRLLRECADVRVLLNGLGGRRLGDQIEELKKLERKLRRNVNENAEIKLAFSRGIFHPKLYLFETRAGSVAWVGSANATVAALGKQARNEEILLRLEPTPPSLLVYAERVWKDGKSLEDCRPAVDSLPAFFRTGDLYYKPYATNPMTLNPFESLLRKLSSRQQERLAAIRLPYVESRAGIGAFSIRIAYMRGSETSDSADGDGVESRPRATFRPYAVETCYGYWVADCFVEQVDTTLDEAAEVKKRFLGGLRDWLTEGPGRCHTIDAYRDYLKTVRETMDSNGVDWEDRLEEGDPNPFDSTVRMEKRIENLAKNLNRKSWRKRLSRAFVSERVPEIWDDVVARQAFEESFFDSLAEQSCKDKRSPAASRLLNAIDVQDEATAQEIQNKLEECLTDPHWYDRSFANMT